MHPRVIKLFVSLSTFLVVKLTQHISLTPAITSQIFRGTKEFFLEKVKKIEVIGANLWQVQLFWLHRNLLINCPLDCPLIKSAELGALVKNARDRYSALSVHFLVTHWWVWLAPFWLRQWLISLKYKWTKPIYRCASTLPVWGYVFAPSPTPPRKLNLSLLCQTSFSPIEGNSYWILFSLERGSPSKSDRNWAGEGLSADEQL